MVYKFRDGYRLKADAQVIGDHLERLAALTDNQFSRAAVVADARKAISPLHNEFDWNVDAAAQAHWLDQAGRIIRSIEFVYVDDKKVEHTAPAFVHVGDQVRSSYMSTPKAMADPERSAAIIAQARSQLAAWHRRFSCLAAIAKDKRLAAALPHIAKAIETPQNEKTTDGKAKDQQRRDNGKRKVQRRKPDQPAPEDRAG